MKSLRVFRGRSAAQPGGGLRSFSLSDIPVKIVAVLLLAIFVPSLLITAVGLFAVYAAESRIREILEYPVREELLPTLERKLDRDWNLRHQRYRDRIEIEEDLHGYVAALPARDTHVRGGIILDADGGVQPFETRSPLWRLEAPEPGDALANAWELEFERSDDQSLVEAERIYSELAVSGAPEAAVEALLGLARVRAGPPLKDWRGALRALEKLVDRFGMSVDESGTPRGLPALLRIVELHAEHPDHRVDAIFNAGRLADLVAELEPWLDADVVAFYQDRLRPYARQLSPARDRVRSTDWALPGRLLDPAVLSQLGEHARGLLAADVSGYLGVPYSEGDQLAAAFYRAPTGFVYLELDPAAYLADAAKFTRELKLADVLRFTDAADGPVFARSEPTLPALVSEHLPPPLDEYQMHYHPRPDPVSLKLQEYKTYQATGLAWAVVVLVLTLSLGILITVRSVLQEMQLARLKSDFVSFVTHELKTPLTAIRMFTETLLLGRAGGERDQRRCIEMIDKEATRLSRLIQSILQFARIEKNQHAFQFSSCEVSDVVEDAVRIFKEHNHDANLEIEVNQAQHISRIQLDRSAIVELILNLMSNAYKYSRGRSKKIVINLRESIDHISVDVVDNGVGISKRDQRKIFDKFYRAQDYLTRDVEGSGLGLSFARYIAKVHNGDIKVSSVVDKGSTFTLELQKNEVMAG